MTDHHKTALTQSAYPIYIDVGMNIGWFSLWALALNATTYSFEPNPINRMRYCESLALNGISHDQAHLFAAGVGAEPANLTLAYKGNNPGAGTLRQNARGNHRFHNIPVVRLDDVAEQERWLDVDSPSIDLLKIDTEGFEPPVIFGAPKLIASRKVRNIMLEYSCEITPERDMKRLTNRLVNAGYKLSSIGRFNGGIMTGMAEKITAINPDNATEGIDDRLHAFCWSHASKQLNLWWKLDHDFRATK